MNLNPVYTCFFQPDVADLDRKDGKERKRSIWTKTNEQKGEVFCFIISLVNRSNLSFFRSPASSFLSIVSNCANANVVSIRTWSHFYSFYSLSVEDTWTQWEEVKRSFRSRRPLFTTLQHQLQGPYRVKLETAVI